MFHRLRFVGCNEKNFLCIGLLDLEELQQMGEVEENNIELSMEALACLQYFPKVENLVRVFITDLTRMRDRGIKTYIF